MQKRIIPILLAENENGQMHSTMHKVLHPLCGRPMLDCAMDAAAVSGTEVTPFVVVGGPKEQIQEHYGTRLRYIEQEHPHGVGSALVVARELLRKESGRALILSGDLPLLRKDTINKLTSSCCDISLLTAELEDNPLPAYCVELVALVAALDTLAQSDNTDKCGMNEIINAMLQQGASVETLCIPAQEATSVRDRIQLAACEKQLRRRINEQHMRNGVTMIDPEATYIDATVKLGQDCTIYPGVVLQGNTVIEEGSTLFPACHIIDSRFGRGVQARGVVARDAVVGDYVSMGPYVHLRPGTKIGNRVKIGNYIEVKNSIVGEGSKLPHLSYIGDGEVGSNANLGCGTVFVNYDGYKKHRTSIGDGAFIGCHTSLVAPVSVGKGSFTAAGSVITEDVPDDTLAVARAKQINKVGYMSKLRAKRGDG